MGQKTMISWIFTPFFPKNINRDFLKVGCKVSLWLIKVVIWLKFLHNFFSSFKKNLWGQTLLAHGPQKSCLVDLFYIIFKKL
jgi:hypothetical protein